MSSSRLATGAGLHLLEAYRSVRRASEDLARPLTAEDHMVQSMPDASPTKWHLAHTTWFFETFVLRSFDWYKEFHADFDWVFNSYYKRLGKHPQRGQRGTFSRPSLEAVCAYRQHVDAAMSRLLSADVDASVAATVTLGINHEQQHQELIVTDIKHAFWTQPLRPVYMQPAPSEVAKRKPALQGWVSFSGGIEAIGHSGETFAFDNEAPRHKVLVQPFRIATRTVTIGEYLAFMEDGGYRRPELWLSDGWDAVTQLGWDSPLYWEREGRDWRVFTVNGIWELEMDEPVCHVSYYEADAYARWRGARLPLEAEWEVSASELKIEGNFAESRRFHSRPSEPGDGLRAMFGDVWEWTASPYVAYPGFVPAPGAVGEYNGKFMCNQFVLRGGSCATPESHIRASYRNFFPPQARWQFTGIRVASDERD